MIDFTLAEILTGLDMSNPEPDDVFRVRVLNEVRRCGDSAMDPNVHMAGPIELDAIAAKYGLKRGEPVTYLDEEALASIRKITGQPER